MNKTTALVFGYNKFAYEIITQVTKTYGNVKIFSLHDKDLEDEKYYIESFDLSDEWGDIYSDVDLSNTVAFCVLEDSAENIFLTISLRAHFKELPIVALATNKESASKLSMAGASKVIPIVETTADIITNMLEKPIANGVLNDILYHESTLKIAQIKLTSKSKLKNEQLSDIDWSRYHGIIVLSVMHEDMSSEFIYSTKAKHHIVQEGDTLVVVGHERDIEEFKQSIEGKTCPLV